MIYICLQISGKSENRVTRERQGSDAADVEALTDLQGFNIYSQAIVDSYNFSQGDLPVGEHNFQELGYI